MVVWRVGRYFGLGSEIEDSREHSARWNAERIDIYKIVRWGSVRWIFICMSYHDWRDYLVFRPFEFLPYVLLMRGICPLDCQYTSTS